MITFQKAERKRAKARVAFCAPSGAGKTHSALLFAAGLGGKIAVIDTENGSASLEAGKPGIPDFDILDLAAPFTPEKYVAALKAAEAAGYDVVIMDSISHAWAGSGGLLEQVDMKAKASKSGNSYTAWRDVTPSHNKLIEAILQSKCHVLATMRTKVEYGLVEDDRGKKIPKKVGMAPIQREGMDYEFTVVFDIDQASHIASVSKDRTSLFDGKPEVLSEVQGKRLSDWINSGAPEAAPKAPEPSEPPKPPQTPPVQPTGTPEAAPLPPTPPAPPADGKISKQSADRIYEQLLELGSDTEAANGWCKERFGHPIDQLSEGQGKLVTDVLEKKIAAENRKMADEAAQTIAAELGGEVVTE